jgi:hypothetical protein
MYKFEVTVQHRCSGGYRTVEQEIEHEVARVARRIQICNRVRELGGSCGPNVFHNNCTSFETSWSTLHQRECAHAVLAIGEPDVAIRVIV